MKLWFRASNVDWDAQRYRYPTEQTLLTLFPGERPEYPNTPVPTDLNGVTNAVLFTLRRGKAFATMTALLLRDGRRTRGQVRFPAEKLDALPEQVYHTVQRALKQAFYKAGSAFLGRDLPWGSLTGVRPVKLPTKALLAGATPAQAERELAKTYRVAPLRRKLAMDCAAQSVKGG